MFLNYQSLNILLNIDIQMYTKWIVYNTSKSALYFIMVYQQFQISRYSIDVNCLIIHVSIDLMVQP